MKNLKLYDPFLWMGLNCLKTTQSLQGDSLLFSTQSPRVLSTYLINYDGIVDCESSILTTRIKSLHLKCKCPVFINIKQTLHYKIEIE